MDTAIWIEIALVFVMGICFFAVNPPRSFMGWLNFVCSFIAMLFFQGISYAILFLSGVRSLSSESYQWGTGLLAVLITALVTYGNRQVKEDWEQAKEKGRIVAEEREYNLQTGRLSVDQVSQSERLTQGYIGRAFGHVAFGVVTTALMIGTFGFISPAAIAAVWLGITRSMKQDAALTQLQDEEALKLKEVAD